MQLTCPQPLGGHSCAFDQGWSISLHLLTRVSLQVATTLHLGETLPIIPWECLPGFLPRLVTLTHDLVW